MWKSEEDMIRDVFALNAFDSPVDEKSYNRFYSNRQEYNLQTKTKNMLKSKFVDPRNGEIINEINLLYDSPGGKNIGRGRGKIIKSNNILEHQLQQQLRMAKPVGFSNEIIESHYSNKKKFNNDSAFGNSSKLPQTEVLEREERLEIFNPNDFPPFSSNKIKRVKAVRNSKKQNNALITSLTSKLKVCSKHS